jgi:hypothetical protein
MTNQELYAEFKTKLAELDGLYDKHKPVMTALNEEWTVVVAAEWKKTQGRKKFSLNKAATALPNFVELKAQFLVRADVIFKTNDAEREALKKRLDDLAEKIEITPEMKLAEKTQWALYGSRSTGDYSTQSLGAETYARGAAKNLLADVTLHGVEAEIREDRREPNICCGWSMPSVTFQVYAACDATVCEIVRRKPGMTLVEWVRRCWASSTNPRVYQPFLSADFEAKNGLDYFGGYVKKKEVTA